MTSSMETFSALLAICAGNSPVSGEFPAQRPVTRSLDVFLDLRLNKRLGKQPWCWWFETPSRQLWRYCNACDRFLEYIQHTLNIETYFILSHKHLPHSVKIANGDCGKRNRINKGHIQHHWDRIRIELLDEYDKMIQCCSCNKIRHACSKIPYTKHCGNLNFLISRIWIRVSKKDQSSALLDLSRESHWWPADSHMLVQIIGKMLPYNDIIFLTILHSFHSIPQWWYNAMNQVTEWNLLAWPYFLDECQWVPYHAALSSWSLSLKAFIHWQYCTVIMLVKLNWCCWRTHVRDSSSLQHQQKYISLPHAIQ